MSCLHEDIGPIVHLFDCEQVMSSHHPFAGIRPTSAKGIAAITQGIAPDPEDHPGLPEDDSLWPLLRRMWSQSSEDRPTIDEVMKEVRHVMG